jgi:hypothetical protein
MTKTEAHAILDRIKTHREPMSIFVTNQALHATGDLCGVFSQPLRSDGNERGTDRACQIHEQSVEVGFSYSNYLDRGKIEGATQ